MSASPVERPDSPAAAAPTPTSAAEAPPRNDSVEQIIAEFAPLKAQPHKPLTLNLFPPRARPRDSSKDPPRDPRFAVSPGTPALGPARPPRADSTEVWDTFRVPPGHQEIISRANSFPTARSGRPVCSRTEESPQLATLNTFPRYNPQGSENRRGYFWHGGFDPSLASPLHSSTVQGRAPSSFATEKSSEDASSGVAYSDLPSILSLDSAPSLRFPGMDFRPGLQSGSSGKESGRGQRRGELGAGLKKPRLAAADAIELADLDQLAFGKWPQYRQAGQARPLAPGGGDECVLSEGGGYENSSVASRDSALRNQPPLWPGDGKSERQLLEMRQLEAERARAERNVEVAGAHVAVTSPLTSPFRGLQGNRPSGPSDWRSEWEASLGAETRTERKAEPGTGEKRTAADAADGTEARRVKRVFWARGNQLPHREGLGESPETLTRAESLAESFAPGQWSQAWSSEMMDVHGFGAKNPGTECQVSSHPQQVFGLKREEMRTGLARKATAEGPRAGFSNELRALDLFPADGEPLLARTRAESRDRSEPLEPIGPTDHRLKLPVESNSIHRPPPRLRSFQPLEAAPIRASPTASPGQSADATWWMAAGLDAPLTVVREEQAAALEGRVLVDYQTGIPVLLRTGSLDSAGGGEATGAFAGGGRWQQGLSRLDEERPVGMRRIPGSEGGYLLPELPAKHHVSSWCKQELADGGARLAAYTCRFCGQSFDKSTALGGHMRCHRGERQQEKLSTSAADEKPSPAVRLSPSFPQWGPFTLTTPR